MSLQLNAQASALLKQVQKNTGPISTEVEQAIVAAQSAEPLTMKQLEKVLLQAMPDQSQVIEAACERCLKYHCDGTNGAFLTQILDTRVEKDFNRVRVTRTRRTGGMTRARDPYYTDMQVDPRADVVLLFNARDVDENGRPLLMKIVARERADLSKVDLTQYRTRENQTSVDDFDVMKISDRDDFIQVIDEDEAEFQFGDPIKQVSIQGDGKELSTTVKVAPANTRRTHFYNDRVERSRLFNTNTETGHNLDDQHVARFPDRLKLKIKTKDTFPEGAWLDDKVGAHLDVGLTVARGLIFEPGAHAEVRFARKVLTATVAEDDAQLVGNAPVSEAIPVATSSTLNQLLRQNIELYTHSSSTGNHDRREETLSLADVLYPDAAKTTLGGKTMTAFGDIKLTQADFEAGKVEASKCPLPNDPDNNGQRIHLKLDKGFLGSDAEANVDFEGYKIVAGYTDHEGKWQACKAETVNARGTNQPLEFDFDVDDARTLHQPPNKNLEVRVYNADGVPAARVNIPFREIDWQL